MGSVKAHGFLPDTVIVSDDAGQFNVGPKFSTFGLGNELDQSPRVTGTGT